MKRDLQIIKALIKEMYEGSTCNECGGAMYEGECVECGHIEEGKLTYTDEYDDNPKLKGKQKRNLPDQLQKAIINKEVETPNPPTDYEGKPAIPGLGPIVDQLQKAIINKEDDSNEPENWKIWQQKMDQGYAQGYEDGWRDGSQGKPKDNPKKSSLSGIGSIIREDHEGQDHEVSMANNSLDSILWAANELKKHLGDQERDIPAWIQDHITNAENYIIQAAKNFHDYGDTQPEMPNDMSLQEMIKKVGSKYNVYSKKGKKLGSHPSKKKAQKQMAAIEISKQGK